MKSNKKNSKTYKKVKDTLAEKFKGNANVTVPLEPVKETST